MGRTKPRLTAMTRSLEASWLSVFLLEWAHQDLNLGPAGYEPAALDQAELWALVNTFGLQDGCYSIKFLTAT